MLSKALAPLAVLLALTSASPLVPRQALFVTKPIAKAAGLAFDGLLLNATAGGLFIGKPTETYCPGDIYPCESFTNITAINIDEINTRASMDVFVPGGQIAYISGIGEFGYTAAHAQNVPSDAYQTGFLRVKAFPSGTSAYAKVLFKGQDWVACPVEEGVWKVKAAFIGYASDCLKFEIQAVDSGTEIAAYQYVAPYTVS